MRSQDIFTDDDEEKGVNALTVTKSKKVIYSHIRVYNEISMFKEDILNVEFNNRS